MKLAGDQTSGSRPGAPGKIPGIHRPRGSPWPARAAVSRPGRVSLIILTILAAALCIVAGCSGGEKGKAPPRAAVPVTATDAVEKDVPVTLQAIGSVEASRTVSIRTRIGGALTRVAFTEGQDVQRGDLLFVIDPRPYQAALEAARAVLARDRAQLINAEADVRRYAALIKEEYVTKQQYDQVATAAEALRNTVRSGEAAVESARLNLRYCTILSPLSGRTGNLLVHEGDQIEANDIVMVVINRIAPVKVVFAVPERHLPEIRRYAAAGNLPVAAGVPQDRGNPSRGMLTFINNTVDPATGTILLKATFPNRERQLWPGQFVNVALTLTVRPRAVVIPSLAVQTGQQGTFVFVIKPDLTAASRPVTPGPETDGEMIIEQGLRAGEKVVLEGQLRLVPGTKVQIQSGVELGGAALP